MSRPAAKGSERERTKTSKPTALSRAKADQAAGKNKGKAGADVMFALAKFKRTHKWARQKGMGDEAMLVARRLARMGGSMYRKSKPAPTRDTGTIVSGIPPAEKKGRIRVPPQPGGRHTPGMRKRTGPTSRNRY